MVKRSVNSPWGNVYKEGLPSTAVDDKTLVDQEVRPVINTGSINVETGKWTGVTLSDEIFKGFTTHTIPNTANQLFPVDGTTSKIDMTGYQSLFIALKPTVAGAVAITAVMGLGTNTFGGLTPLNAAVTLQGNYNGIGYEADLETLFHQSSQILVDNVWNIYIIQGRLEDQKNLQFKITNNAGAESTIDFAYMRMV